MIFFRVEGYVFGINRIQNKNHFKGAYFVTRELKSIKNMILYELNFLDDYWYYFSIDLHILVLDVFEFRTPKEEEKSGHSILIDTNEFVAVDGVVIDVFEVIQKNLEYFFKSKKSNKVFKKIDDLYNYYIMK